MYFNHQNNSSRELIYKLGYILAHNLSNNSYNTSYEKFLNYKINISLEGFLLSNFRKNDKFLNTFKKELNFKYGKNDKNNIKWDFNLMEVKKNYPEFYANKKIISFTGFYGWSILEHRRYPENNDLLYISFFDNLDEKSLYEYYSFSTAKPKAFSLRDAEFILRLDLILRDLNLNRLIELKDIFYNDKSKYNLHHLNNYFTTLFYTIKHKYLISLNLGKVAYNHTGRIEKAEDTQINSTYLKNWYDYDCLKKIKPTLDLLDDYLPQNIPKKMCKTKYLPKSFKDLRYNESMIHIFQNIFSIKIIKSKNIIMKIKKFTKTSLDKSNKHLEKNVTQYFNKKFTRKKTKLNKVKSKKKKIKLSGNKKVLIDRCNKYSIKVNKNFTIKKLKDSIRKYNIVHSNS